MDNIKLPALKNSIKEINSNKIFKAEGKNILYLGFHKSTSKNFNLVMTMLGDVFIKGRRYLNDKEMFVAHFQLDDSFHAEVAISILDLICNWKGVLAVHNGRKMDSLYSLMVVIECIIDGKKCNNHLAHCLYVERNYLYTNSNAKYILPCKQLLGIFKYQQELPVSIEDQIQACAVTRNTYWCPLFDIGNFKKL